VIENSCQLHLGDCLDIMQNMSDNSADVTIVDPPYGIDYQSARRSDKTQWKPKIRNDKEPFLGWGKDAYRITRKAIYVFYRWDKQQAFLNEIVSSGFDVKSQIIWNKIVHGMGDLNSEYAPQHESILFAIKDGFVFPRKRPRTIINQRRVMPNDLLHPNEKPVPLIEKLILDSTEIGDTVLDFTMGSCSAGVASVKHNRKFIGIEIDPDYFDIAQKRIAEAQMQPLLF